MRWEAITAGYELEFEDVFEGDGLDGSRWIPHYLPQWSTRQRSAARYEVGGGRLRLLIEADQEPWCPELDGDVRVSSLQTGVFAGPVGSAVGQHRFNPEAVVREAQQNIRLYTPRYGLVELRARATDDPRIADEFSAETVPIDARELHRYAAEWTPERVSFFVDRQHVKTVRQSPSYPMQLMLGIYELPAGGEGRRGASAYPKELTVDYVRGYRPAAR